MKRIERIRKSVISRALAGDDSLHLARAQPDPFGVYPSGSVMRHLLYRARMQQRQIVDKLLDEDAPEPPSHESWW